MSDIETATGPRVQCCANCLYHHNGHCRRMPPVPAEGYGELPRVRDDHWCGEWKPRGMAGARAVAPPLMG